MELSWIQKHILLILIRNKTARYKELMPPDMAANLFSYHLNGLVNQKLVSKIGLGNYTLTAKGEKLVGTFSTLLDSPVENIKTVVMLVSTTDNKQLVFRWSRQPYLGKVTPLYDRMPLGKTLEAGLASALNDKLGSIFALKFKTSALIKIMHDDLIISHMNALIYQVDLAGAKLPYVSRNGESFLSDANENWMQGVEEFFNKVDVLKEPFESIWVY